VKYNVPKNCAIGRNNFDSDSGSFADRIARNIRYRRFFPKQEEKVASIEQIIDATIQAVFVRITTLTPTLTPKDRYNYLLQLVWFGIKS
jgi:hypothetical protein